jgi:hypothetical protein
VVWPGRLVGCGPVRRVLVVAEVVLEELGVCTGGGIALPGNATLVLVPAEDELKNVSVMADTFLGLGPRTSGWG